MNLYRYYLLPPGMWILPGASYEIPPKSFLVQIFFLVSFYAPTRAIQGSISATEPVEIIAAAVRVMAAGVAFVERMPLLNALG